MQQADATRSVHRSRERRVGRSNAFCNVLLQDGSTLTDVSDSSLEYVPVANWGALPLGFSFNGDGNAVAVDSNDLVYVFNRGPRPILIFDADGKLLGGWGDGQFDNPHSIRIDAADNLYLVDARPGHTVQKRSKDGELLLQIGSRESPQLTPGILKEAKEKLDQRLMWNLECLQ